MTDRDKAQDALQGYWGETGMSNPKDTALQIAKRRKVSVPLTDGGTAGSASGEVNFFRADVAVKVISCHFDGGVAITADNTDYITLLVQKRPVSGPATPATVATNTSQTADTVLGANYVADTPVSLTLTAANVSLAAGDILTAKCTKTGAGKAIGAAATAKGASAWLHFVLEEL